MPPHPLDNGCTTDAKDPGNGRLGNLRSEKFLDFARPVVELGRARDSSQANPFRASGAQPASGALDDKIPFDLRPYTQGEQECLGRDVHVCSQVLAVVHRPDGSTSFSALGDHVIDFA